jgi:hypothetical protein
MIPNSFDRQYLIKRRSNKAKCPRASGLFFSALSRGRKSFDRNPKLVGGEANPWIVILSFGANPLISYIGGPLNANLG